MTVRNLFAMCILSMVVTIEVIAMSSSDALAFHRADLHRVAPGDCGTAEQHGGGRG